MIVIGIITAITIIGIILIMGIYPIITAHTFIITINQASRSHHQEEYNHHRTIMADGNRALYDSLKRDGLYTKSYKEFVRQFADTEKQKRLYAMLNADKLYSRTADDFAKQFFTPIKRDSAIPQYKYKSTRDYSIEDRQTLLENMELERKFGEKYNDKNLYTRYAHINADEELKDLLVQNENKVDPYTLAGVISGEGLIDELVGSQSEFQTELKSISRAYSGESIGGFQTLGLDDFLNRYEELKKKGYTSLRMGEGETDQESIDTTFIPDQFESVNEKFERTRSVLFRSPKGAINAVSAYVRNIGDLVDKSGVKMTPEEREQLIYMGYNYGEGGLSQYLKKSKTAKEVIEKIKKERPQVYKHSLKRIAVANELRESGSFDPIEPTMSQ